jgi:hypothetical protein
MSRWPACIWVEAQDLRRLCLVGAASNAVDNRLWQFIGERVAELAAAVR